MNMNMSRRKALMTGIVGAPAVLHTEDAEAAGESWSHVVDQPVLEKTDQPTVVAMMGQHCHNPIMLELNLRAILAKMNWRILFTQYSEFLTKELIDIADVTITLIGNSDYDRHSVGYSPYGVVENRPPRSRFMTEEQEHAIYDNVANKGKGYLCLHNSICSPRPLIKKMLAHDWAMHPPIQNVQYRDFNPDHPISRGIEPFLVSDEQFFARLHNPDHTVLFESTGTRYLQKGISGWCNDYGKGRFVTLLPGHTEFVWRNPSFQELVLRSCLWLMKKAIPENTRELVDAQRPMDKVVGTIEWRQ